jgi:hypothetical protein
VLFFSCAASSHDVSLGLSGIQTQELAEADAVQSLNLAPEAQRALL